MASFNIPDGATGFDAEKLAEAFAVAMEECGMSDGGGVTTRGPSKKIREVDEGEELGASGGDEDDDDGDEFDPDNENSPWERIQRGLKKRLVTCSPLDPPDFRVGCYALVHFRSTILEPGGAEVMLDDTQFLKGGPMEYLVSEDQLFPLLMKMLSEMRVQEVAHYIAAPDIVDGYVESMAWWRRVCERRRPAHMERHEDGRDFPVAADDAGTAVGGPKSCGYADLDAFARNPRPLRFEVEFCALDEPCAVDRDMHVAESAADKEALVTRLRERGVALYKLGRLDMALDRFCAAADFAEELVRAETPAGARFRELQLLMLPVLLNCVQCALNRGEFERAEAWCSLALAIEPTNVRALFRRGRALAGMWEPAEARRSFHLALEQDARLKAAVESELAVIDEREIDESRKTAELLAAFSQSGTLELTASQRREFERVVGSTPPVAGGNAERGAESCRDDAGSDGPGGVLEGPFDGINGRATGVGSDDDVVEGQFDSVSQPV